MKYLRYFLIIFLSIFFVSCSSHNTYISSKLKNKELEDAPSWVFEPKIDGYLCAVGIATKNSANDFSFQRAEAIADARNNLAKKINIRVKGSYKRDITSSEGFTKKITTYDEQSVDEMLKNSTIKKMWISRSGTIYVLVAIKI